MTRSAEVARNAVVNYGGRVYTSVLAFVILSLVLPRALAEHDFGVLTFYLTLSMLLASMLDFGAGLVVVREAARARDRAGRLIGILVRIKAWVGLAGAVGLVALALAFDGLSTRALLITIAALHLPFHALTAALVIHHVDMAFERVVAANALGQTAWLVATIALVFAGVAEPGAYVLAFGAGPVVAGFAAGTRRARASTSASTRRATRCATSGGRRGRWAWPRRCRPRTSTSTR